MILPLGGIAGLVSSGLIERLSHTQKAPSQTVPSSERFGNLLLHKEHTPVQGPALSREALIQEKRRLLLESPEVKIPLIDNACVAMEKIELFQLADGEYYLGDPHDPAGHKLRIKDLPEHVQAQAQALLQVSQSHTMGG